MRNAPTTTIQLDKQAVVEQILKAWKVHNDINLYLIGKIPAAGFNAVPSGSRGRTVAEQLIHMNRVRLGWLYYHNTGKRPKSTGRKSDPTRAQFRKVFADSGKAIGKFLLNSLEGNGAPRAFGRQAVRWMGYLISHESHHRGAIMLALKQSGMRLPEKISIQGLWGKWMWGS